MGRIPVERIERARVAAARSGQMSGWSHSPRVKVSYGSNFLPPEIAAERIDVKTSAGRRRERFAMLGIGTEA